MEESRFESFCDKQFLGCEIGNCSTHGQLVGRGMHQFGIGWTSLFHCSLHIPLKQSQMNGRYSMLLLTIQITRFTPASQVFSCPFTGLVEPRANFGTAVSGR